MVGKKLRSEAEFIQSWKGDIKKPLVSIGCLTYNHEECIGDAIQGIFNARAPFFLKH